MKLIGRIVCFFKGHKRGKFIREADIDGDLYRLYNCPRCERETRYKVKDKIHAMTAGQNHGTTGDQT